MRAASSFVKVLICLQLTRLLLIFQDNGVIVGPSKAANAGGVATSCIEMGQNAGHTVYTHEDVYEQLHKIMVNIHKNCADASQKYYGKYDLVKGANIAGFEKVANAMMEQDYVQTNLKYIKLNIKRDGFSRLFFILCCSINQAHNCQQRKQIFFCQNSKVLF